MSSIDNIFQNQESAVNMTKCSLNIVQHAVHQRIEFEAGPFKKLLKNIMGR